MIYKFKNNQINKIVLIIICKTYVDIIHEYLKVNVVLETNEEIKIKQTNEAIVQRKIELDFNNVYEYANYIVLSVYVRKKIKTK